MTCGAAVGSKQARGRDKGTGLGMLLEQMLERGSTRGDAAWSPGISQLTIHAFYPHGLNEVREFENKRMAIIYCKLVLP
jgi:hypothetical protein